MLWQGLTDLPSCVFLSYNWGFWHLALTVLHVHALQSLRPSMSSELPWMDYPFIANSSYSFKTPLKEHVFQKVPSDLASSVLGCHYTCHAPMITQNSPGVGLIQHLSSWLETNLVFLFVFPPDHEPFKAGFACFHYTLHPGTELGTQQAFSFNKHMQLHWIIYYVKVIYQSSLKHMKWILTIKPHMVVKKIQMKSETQNDNRKQEEAVKEKNKEEKSWKSIHSIQRESSSWYFRKFDAVF